MSPYQHGEVYVTDDGAETDLDLGHYERFTNQVTTPQQQLHDRQDLPVGHPEGAPRRLPRAHRAGHPAHHRRDQGQHPRRSRDDVDVVIVEIGGTVGDIESLPFLEAIRQLRQDVGRENTLYIHLTLVPFIGAAGELKTKPTQHSVRDLRAIGIQPDILLCRTDRVPRSGHQAEDRAVLRRRRGGGHHGEGRVEHLRGAAGPRGRGPRPDRPASGSHLPQTEARMDAWIDLVDRIKNPTDEITIHVVGKYVGYEDSYKSLNEALYHGGFKHRLRVNIRWVEAEALEQPGGEQLLDGADGILVPGGFGDRGTRGMMRAAEIARERGIPYFGICYGFQWAAVEYARHVCGLADADSTECAPGHAAQGHLQAARSARRRRPRRHHAARLVRVRAQAGLDARTQLYGSRRHPRAAPPPLRVQLPLREGADRARVWRSSAARSTASSSRSSSCRRIRGSSRCSSTPSSSRSRSSRIRCSPASSTPATGTSSPRGQHAPRRPW